MQEPVLSRVCVCQIVPSHEDMKHGYRSTLKVEPMKQKYLFFVKCAQFQSRQKVIWVLRIITYSGHKFTFLAFWGILRQKRFRSVFRFSIVSVIFSMTFGNLFVVVFENTSIFKSKYLGVATSNDEKNQQKYVFGCCPSML